jgi:hypothetical protein
MVEPTDALDANNQDSRTVTTGAPKANGMAASVTNSHYRTELGRRLREIRARYIANGGELLTADQLDAELANLRGERQPEEGA